MFGLGKKKKKKEDISKKSSLLSSVNASNDGFISFYQDLLRHVYPKQAYSIYGRVSTVYDAVEKISNKVADLKLQLKESNEIIREHEILNLLTRGAVTKTKMWREITTSALLTSEVYLVLRGRIDKEPLQIEVIRPYNVEGVASYSGEKRPPKIRTLSAKDNREYLRYEENDGSIRYYDSGKMNELVPIVINQRTNSWRGLSRLSVLIDEVFHIESGNKHNSNLLDKGMTPSITLAADGEEIDAEDIESIKESLEERHYGYQNAGKPLILPVPLRKVGETRTNKDMDYIQLVNLDETRIYRLFNIPLPLVKDKTMTQSNYTAAIPFLYMDAIIPTFQEIAEEFTRAIIRNRYELDDMELTYDKFSIPALKKDQVDKMEKMTKTGTLTTNEIRKEGGYEKVNGGDDILVNAGKIPLDEATEKAKSFEGLDE